MIVFGNCCSTFSPFKKDFYSKCVFMPFVQPQVNSQIILFITSNPKACSEQKYEPEINYMVNQTLILRPGHYAK
jgi:hypothetical protein